ncbi:hypothetical protein EV132_104382 [Rhizobium sullae]|uniref:Uncharacterized protein n=1 Tax=Rhizobium sullae TaxID=50338 RepID=A0A4R3Q7N0_RHISU|nr:hypothetical protein EV132_104382 [Rhizobium sullae]
MPVQPSGDIQLEQNEINRRGGEPSMPDYIVDLDRVGPSASTIRAHSEPSGGSISPSAAVRLFGNRCQKKIELRQRC